MAEKYRDTDYLYGSARVRAMESRLLTKEKTEHMVEAKSAAEIVAMLPDFGFSLRYEGEEKTGELLREDTLLSVLEQGYAELNRMDQGRGLCNFLRYPYDCNNIKAVIKCFSREIEPEDMLFDAVGTLRAQAVKEAFDEKNYEMFPPHMAQAIPEAEDAFAKTGNPQQVDLILDRACYADMLDAAQSTGVAYAVRLVRAKIDLTNVITCIRLVRMNMGASARAFLSEALLDGGSLDRAWFKETLREGEEYLSERLFHSPYAELSATLEGGRTPLNILERKVDDLWLGLASEGKYVSFGAEVLIGYAIALEYEVKNIRILLAGKDAGLAPDVIRERLRKSYV